MFEIKNVSMIYDMDSDEKMYALSNVDLELPERGLVGIIGPSGSGKSTLMYCLSTLKKPTEGSILYKGEELTALTPAKREMLRRQKFGFIFQKHYLVPYMTAFDNCVVSALPGDPEAAERAKSMMSRLGLREKEFKKRPAKLSGGQCQRVAIARAMINGPEVVFADEPTASLDHENAFNVMRVLREYAEEHLVLVVTHDRSILQDADRIIEIWDGRISAIKDAER
ncbi:MAG: ABC transporter ATP-binding protein [Lachnospiraceae bacterium]|nr:ABC transporter ATP-binding protein [Lachnospiraceae bacterium]